MNFRYLLLLSLGTFFIYVLLLPKHTVIRKFLVLCFVSGMLIFALNPGLVDGDCKLFWHCSRGRFPFLSIPSHAILHCFRVLSKVQENGNQIR